MSLPDVAWRYVGRYTYGAGTIQISTIMDGIYSLATGTTYIDGAPRVQGSGSAGTWNRYQTGGGITEAIYVTPPSGSQAIIIAGSSGTPSPTPDMCPEVGFSSAFATNKLFVNIVKNPGAFDSWNNATNPFSSGNSMGYIPFLGSRTVASTGITSYNGVLSSYLFESKESIAIFLMENTGTSTNSYSNGFIAGALIDPQSANLFDAETDGRVYGIFSTGHSISLGTVNASWGNSNANLNSIWHTTYIGENIIPNTTSFLFGYLQINQCSGRAGIFQPGTGNVKPVVVGNNLSHQIGNNVARTALTSSGKYVRLPIIVKGALTSDSVVFGSLRNIYYCKDGLIGQRHMDGATTVGYLVSCSNNSAITADAILLEY